MHHSGHNSKMMWGMMAGCLLLLAVFLLFGKNFGGASWLPLVFLAVCAGSHILMMFGHKKDEQKDEDNNTHHHE